MEIPERSRQVKQIYLLSKRLVNTFFAGGYRSVFRGQGLAFEEVREYIEGDDSRFIDWNVTSRMVAPYVKIFREEREVALQLIVDLSKSMAIGVGDPSKKEVILTLFALFSFAAIANHDRVGSLFFTDRVESFIPPGKGRKHLLRQIFRLFSFQPEGGGSDLGLAIRTSLERVKKRGIVVILSDFRSKGYWRNLALLAKKHEVVAVRITDAFDREVPTRGLIRWEDPETGKILIHYGRSKSYRAAYRSFEERQKSSWEAGCRMHKVDRLEIDTSEDLIKTLRGYFERRKRRR